MSIATPPGEQEHDKQTQTRISKSFAETLRKHRLAAGLTQEALAFEAGLHRTYVGRLERSLKSPTLNTLFKLSAALGVQPERLVAETNNALGQSTDDRAVFLEKYQRAVASARPPVTHSSSSMYLRPGGGDVMGTDGGGVDVAALVAALGVDRPHEVARRYHQISSEGRLDYDDMLQWASNFGDIVTPKQWSSIVDAIYDAAAMQLFDHGETYNRSFASPKSALEAYEHQPRRRTQLIPATLGSVPYEETLRQAVSKGAPDLLPENVQLIAERIGGFIQAKIGNLPPRNNAFDRDG